METVHAAGASIPVEQSPAWAQYDSVLPGREHWRYLIATEGDHPIAAISLTLFAGRFLEQLWGKQGPVWLGDAESRTAAAELALRDALTSYIKKERPSATVLRLHAEHPAADLVEPLIGVYYDRTVVLDLTKDEEQLLAEASQSGRRNIRKALKNPGLTFNDETGLSESEFAETIYPIFEETGRRGGFVLRPPAFYYEMLRQLGPDVCRLFTVRLDGEVVSWALVTIYDDQIDYYYAASTTAARKVFAAYLMAWSTMKWAKAQGISRFDFLGCGSKRVPNLDTLNEFKLSFNKHGLLDVPGPWDVVLRPSVLRAYHAQRRAIAGVGAAKRTARKVAANTPRSPRQAAALADTAESAVAARAVSRAGDTAPATDAPAVVPVILDFSLSGYALARAFHEAYGITSIAVLPFTTGATADSSIIPDVRVLGVEANYEFTPVLAELRKIGRENPGKTVIPLTNHDGIVQALSAARDTLGKNVLVPHETPDMLKRVSDKHEFNKLCDAAGAATPKSIVLDFAGGRPTADFGSLTWPVILKPADSGLYATLRMTGKEKLYKVTSAVQLDAWIDRHADAGYQGEMLVQEFIPGDDLLSITLYRARDGRITLARASRVLAQDPRPAFLGIPDVQLVDDLPDAIDGGVRILEEADYYGFANLDAIRDPRDGRVVFFEINPRYGRNCYYATASGANVAQQLVADLIENSPVDAPPLAERLLYTTLPPAFLKRYLKGDARAAVVALTKAGCWVDPVQYDGERNPKHRLYARLAPWNHARVYRSAPTTLADV